MTEKRLVGPFGAGIKAEEWIQGRRFVQVETQRQNELVWSQAIDTIGSWPRSGLNTVTADDIESPDGTITADKVIENAFNSPHYVNQSVTPDGSSKYCYSIYAKAGGRDWIKLLAGWAGTPLGYFDLTNGVVGTTAGVDDSGIEYVGNGWYRCWIVMTSIAAAPASMVIYLSTGDGVDSYLGDDSSAVYLWQAQMEIGDFPSSPNMTVGIQNALARDILYFADANVPTDLRGKFAVKLIPFYDQDTDDDHYIYRFNVNALLKRYLFYKESLNKFRLHIDGTDYDSDVVTFSRSQKIMITTDPSAGTVTISGCTTGNGVITGIAWDAEDGDVYWGMDDSNTLQFNGILSEPFKV